MLGKYIIAFIIAVSLITVNMSCSNVEEVEKVEFPPYFTVEETELSFISAGEKKSISLVTTVPWEAVSSEDWLSITPNSGEYNSKITVTALANESLTDARTATISLIPESGEEIIISVSQNKMNSSINASVNELSLFPFGDEKTVVVSSNSSWIATSSEDWLSLSDDGQTLTLKANANYTGSNRAAVVTLTASVGGAMTEIDISQSEGTLLFPGADFEDWDLYEKSNIWPIHEDFASIISQSPEGTGMNGGRALSIKGSIKVSNPPFLKVNVPEGFSLEGKTKAVFYIKGATTIHGFSINWFKPNGNNFYTFYTGEIKGDKYVDKLYYPKDSPTESAGNNYNGVIHTNGEWVKVSLNLEALTFGSSVDEGKALVQFRAGGKTAPPYPEWDILIDNISLE